jgi:hypothetical protein
MVDAFTLDPKVVQELVEKAVKENILSTLENMVQDSNWLAKIEKMINQTATQKTIDRLTSIDINKIVSDQVNSTFSSETIQTQVTDGVQKDIELAISTITQDPKWLNRIEDKINQAVTYQTITKISSMDINTIIRDRVDENIDRFQEKLREDFASTGIKDQSTKNQMTIMDDHTVFENNLTAQDLTIANSAQIQNLVVTGSINTDNHAWTGLSADIAEKTFSRVTKAWQSDLVQQVAEYIKINGIEFDQVTIGGTLLVDGNRLAETIKETSIQTTGVLRTLQVAGETHLNETFSVVRKRVGVNTEEPEMALSVWDEEVSVNIGKNKLNQAYIGTGRAQGIAIGTNRVAHVEITADGLTQIKKLQVGVHKISHATEVPGWSGTKGDMVFNANPGSNRVFAWVCLGAFKWQVLKSAE